MIEFFKKQSDPIRDYKVYPSPSHWSLGNSGLVISALRRSTAPLTIYVHIPFVSASCVELLVAEMDLTDVAHNRPVVQIHWGGAGASRLYPRLVDDLLSSIVGRFSISVGTDLRVEINRPEFVKRAGADLISFGIGAISHVGHTLAQNYLELSSYEDAVGSGRLPVFRGYVLSRDDLIRGTIIETCTRSGAISKDDIERRFRIKFDEYFKRELASLEALEHDGLVEDCTSRTIRITCAGRVFIRAVVRIFDAFEHAGAVAKAV